MAFVRVHASVVVKRATPRAGTTVQPEAERRWVGAWTASAQLMEPFDLPPPPGLDGHTLRQVIRPTLGGTWCRLQISNEWGDEPLELAEAQLARALANGLIDPATIRTLTFDGHRAVSIPAGTTRFSDPCQVALRRFEALAITFAVRKAPRRVTGHPGSRTTSYVESGNVLRRSSFHRPTRIDHWYFITALDADAEGARAVVTLGDSITDGRGSTTNGDDRWTDALARRFAGEVGTCSVAVLNQGLGGNACVAGGLGPTALSRFRRDALEQRGVGWIIIQVGVNDIGGRGLGAVDRLINAYESFIDQARRAGIATYGVPILPFGGSSYDVGSNERARSQVNAWIRDSGRFDAVLDLDRAVRDSARPTHLCSAYDSGDGLHPSPRGYLAMANAVEPSLFGMRHQAPLVARDAR